MSQKAKRTPGREECREGTGPRWCSWDSRFLFSLASNSPLRGPSEEIPSLSGHVPFHLLCTSRVLYAEEPSLLLWGLNQKAPAEGQDTGVEVKLALEIAVRTSSHGQHMQLFLKGDCYYKLSSLNSLFGSTKKALQRDEAFLPLRERPLFKTCT